MSKSQLCGHEYSDDYAAEGWTASGLGSLSCQNWLGGLYLDILCWNLHQTLHAGFEKLGPAWRYVMLGRYRLRR